MRVANSTTLSEVLGEMGASTPSTQAQNLPENQSFANEMAAVSEQQAAAGTSARSTTSAEVAESNTEPNPLIGQPTLDGLIALGAAQAALPLSASNAIFNLVTSADSVPYANECRAAVDVALRSAGMDPAQFKMSFWEEAVGYPGGGYMNRCITVETPEGYRMDFDAAATLRNPRVTAAGIQLLQSGYWNTAAAVVS
jgi:hypothetical protein